jgi:hypothetical protein
VPASLGPRLRTAGGAKWRRGGLDEPSSIVDRECQPWSKNRKNLTESMRIATYSDLEARMAEFEEELRRDPTSFAPLPPKR